MRSLASPQNNKLRRSTPTVAVASALTSPSTVAVVFTGAVELESAVVLVVELPFAVASMGVGSGVGSGSGSADFANLG